MIEFFVSSWYNFLTGTIPLFVACIILIAIWWISTTKSRRLRTQMNQSEDFQYTEIYERIDDQIVLVTKRTWKINVTIMQKFAEKEALWSL